MQYFRLLCLLISFLTLSVAIGLDASPYEGQEGALARRDDNTSSSDSTTSSSSNSDNKPTPTSKDDNSSSSSSSSGKKDSSKTITSSSHKSTHTSYDPRDPPGGISMITPAVTAQQQFYKIGDWVTFAWNYTSLSSTPKHVDVLATCTANQATYTLAVNASVKDNQMVLWDTGAYQASASIPLLTETYTLIIYDSLSSPSAPPEAGYLAAFNNYLFYMYSPLPYTPLADFNCATCNAAISSLERQTMTFLLGMCGITVLTFTWFANSFGLF